MAADLNESWGFAAIVTGGLPGAPGPEEVTQALYLGARDRGIDPAHASDSLDASRDVIIDDVIHGVIGGLRAGEDWAIDGETLFAVWDGIPLAGVIAQFRN